MKNISLLILLLGSVSLSASQKYPPIQYHNCYQPQPDRWTQGPLKSGLGNSAVYIKALEFMTKAKIHLENMLGGYSIDVTPVSRPGSTIVFAYKTNRFADCVGFVAFRKTAVEGVVEIMHIAVEPYHWQQGIGAMLLQSITVDSAIPSIKKLVTTVNATNTIALQFFHKNGFVTISQFSNESDAQNFVTLEKTIS